MDPDQDRHSVGPDLGPNCLQMLSADDKQSLIKSYEPEGERQQSIQVRGRDGDRLAVQQGWLRQLEGTLD